MSQPSQHAENVAETAAKVVQEEPVVQATDVGVGAVDTTVAFGTPVTAEDAAQPGSQKPASQVAADVQPVASQQQVASQQVASQQAASQTPASQVAAAADPASQAADPASQKAEQEREAAAPPPAAPQETA